MARRIVALLFSRIVMVKTIAVKDDAASKFGHRLFVPAFLLADGGLGLLYEVVEFFF